MTGTNSAPSWEHRHTGPAGQVVTHSHKYGDYGHGHDDMTHAAGWQWSQAERKTCAYCGVTGLPERFEAINAGPSVACIAATACALRQAGNDPASFLGRLIRELGTPAELRAMSTRELAELDYDVHGGISEPWNTFAGFARHLSGTLGSRAEGASERYTVEADRAARKRRRAALKGAETRRQNAAARS